MICKKCNCDSSAKTISCSSRFLKKLFPASDWSVLNETTVDYEEFHFDVNQLEDVDVQFPLLRFPLKVIDLSHNTIKTIVKKAFINLNYLEEVDLSFNELPSENLKPEIFEGKFSPDEEEPLMSLKRLRLSYNRLNNLDPELFEHTTKLQELYLDNNPFQIIHPNVLQALADLSQLQLLDMSRMELKTIPEEIFHPLKALKVLYLEGNLFTSIPPALRLAVNVRELSLCANPISDLNKNNAMPAMPKLETLHMTYMPSLTTIGDFSMSGLKSLTTLNISHNHHLSSIERSSFTFTEENDSVVWPPIEKLYLEYNNLTTLDDVVFANYKMMKEVHLHMNPW